MKKNNFISPSETLEQIGVDLIRHARIFIYQPDKKRITELEVNPFYDPERVKLFLQILARKDQRLFEYLKLHLHSAGFLCLAEILTKEYFEEAIVLSPMGKQALFTLNLDHSLGFEEKFTIQKIKEREVLYEQVNQAPVASIQVKSNICIVQNILTHSFQDIHLKTYDQNVANYFDNSENRGKQFLYTLKEKMEKFFTQWMQEFQTNGQNVQSNKK